MRPGTKRPALHGEKTCTRTGPCASGHKGGTTVNIRRAVIKRNHFHG